MMQMDGNISTIRCVANADFSDVPVGTLLTTTGWNTGFNAAVVKVADADGADVSAVMFTKERWDEVGDSVSALEVKSTVIAPVLAGESITAGHYVMTDATGKAKSAGATLAAVAANMFVVGKALESAAANELFMCEMKALLG